MKIKEHIESVRNFIDRFEPITSKILHDNIFAIAGQSAFFIILSAVPLSMFIVSILQNLHIPVDFIEMCLSGVFSEQIVDEISEFLTNAYNNAVGISLITLIITLWSAAQGIHAITNGLNRIYDAYENRNWFFLRIRAMFYTIAFFAIILISLVIIGLGSTINKWLSPYIKYLPDFVALIYHLRYVLIFLFLVVLFALVYRNFPNISRKQHKEYGIRYQLPGAFLCTLSWYVLSLGISIYVDNFNGFSIYGGLATLAGIMIWLYFCMVCLMICAEINYVYHKQIKNFSLKSLIKKLKNKKSHKKNK
ncbi:YihY/virulence factor BrkB family protein [uncultured Ruminococcus sp.]|uniref:YihY/virulence factor BrkB family protein n=1 Tax=uncultured Ruminococcus sp. TaxID=165186 RepID=UPI0025E787A4|nr:YihY/virulence factor BrkB family protein [uncultured Ruminococcus sp.]